MEIREKLIALCKEHSLSGIGVNLYSPQYGEITIYLHAPDFVSWCASGTGADFDEAFSIALAGINERRANANTN